MTIDFVINNAKVYYNKNIVECCIAIEEGKIFKIGKETNMPQSDEKRDVHNLLVLPGVIDSHVHLRDENKAHKETFLSGTAAAAAGGVTTVLDMPNNSPVTMSFESLKNRMKTAERKILVNTCFYSEFPTKLNEVKNIVAEGAIGFKLFMAEQIGGLNIQEDKEILGAFIETSKLNIPVAVHAEDNTLIKKLTTKIGKNKDLKSFLKVHDESVEFRAIKRLLKINKQINAPLHFCHLSTKKSLEIISEAKKLEKNITCEVTPHHLLLSREVYKALGNWILTLPPLREVTNVDALMDGINNCVDVIGSDHAPHTFSEKESSNIWEIKCGIPGLETILPLMLTLVNNKQISIHRMVELLSEKPSEIFQIDKRGYLNEGNFADLVVIDYKKKFKIDAKKFQSKAKFSPFNSWEVKGKPLSTYVNGCLVMDEGAIIGNPRGAKIIRRKTDEIHSG